MKWQIVAEHRDEFLKKGLSHGRKGGGRGSSGPSSPTKDAMTPADSDRRSESQRIRDLQQDGVRSHNKHFMKTSPGSTPPVSAYPTATQAYTPDRGGVVTNRFPGSDISSPRLPYIAGNTSPVTLNRRNRQLGFNDAAAAGSPGGPAMLPGSDTHDHLVTPFITRHVPKLAPPSTAHLPSQFMPMSSPAPFWKYADFGSTPARAVGLDLSPHKQQKEDNATSSGQDDPSRANGISRGVHSSSPPLPENMTPDSPTRSIAARTGDRLAGQPSLMPAPEIRSQKDKIQKQNEAVFPSVPNGLSTNRVRPNDNEEEEEDEVPIDLAR